MRITTDSNILVRAAVRPLGPAGQVLDRSSLPPHALVLSMPILDEVRRVLQYERIRQLAGISDEEREEWIALVAAVSDVISPTEIVPVCQDPDDDLVIATAVAGRSNVVCTLDRHLRAPLVQAYCATFHIRILTDVELLAELRAQESCAGDTSDEDSG
jgi:putative PIN family toxin of toxin-antitoxin system